MNFQYSLLVLLSVGILARAQFSLCFFIAGGTVCGELQFSQYLTQFLGGKGGKDKGKDNGKGGKPEIHNSLPSPSTYDVVVNFTKIEDAISGGFDIILSPELLHKSQVDGLNIDQDFFKGYTVIVVGIFKKGKSWFCQKLSNIYDDTFSTGQDVSTDGFSIKRVQGDNYAYNVVDVQGSGVPVESLSTEALIHQQILEEIIQEAAFQVGHAYIQVINDFTNADQALMLLTATKALANDRVSRANSAQSLFILVHNLRDKQLSEFPGYFRKNVINKLPNGQCLPIGRKLISDEDEELLSKVSRFDEKLCGELLPGRFYMSAEINGKTTYHYFLVSENHFGGDTTLQNAAKAMNNIAVYHIRFSLQTMLGSRQGQTRGIVQPILDAISSEIPKYLTDAPVAVLQKSMNVNIDGSSTATNIKEDNPPPVLDKNGGVIRVKFQDGLRVRSELYEVIPTSRLPLPTPPIPYRIYQNSVTHPDEPDKVITTVIVVELELSGFDISNFNTVGAMGALKKVGRFLEITLFKKPQHLTKLGTFDLVEVFSERKFGSRTTKIFVPEEFLLPRNAEIKLCAPDNGVYRIIIKEANTDFPPENEFGCNEVVVVDQLPPPSVDGTPLLSGNILAFARSVYNLIQFAVTRRN